MSFTLTAAAVADSPAADVVFVHGLGGTASESWNYSGRDGTVHWPALLGQKISTVNVSLVGYPTAKLGKLLGGSDIGILTAAAGVVDLLAGRRIGELPIIFVAHSLGGIVVKAALRQCADSTDPRKHAIFSSSRGVIFFGTPNTGASMGNVCAHLPGLASMQAAELSRADALLMELSQWFRSKAGNSRIRAHSFYETERLNGLIVVDAGSANPGVEGCDPVPVTHNHVDMCKLPSAEHSTFVSVQSFIEATLNGDLPETPALLTEDSVTTLSAEYLKELFRARDIRHSAVPQVDERSLFVDPIIYHENKKHRITNIASFYRTAEASPGVILYGRDRSGKSLISKLLQVHLCDSNLPAIRIHGSTISNADIRSLLDRAERTQFGRILGSSNTGVIIDDFDECQLPDGAKEKIVADIIRDYRSLIITSFSVAPSVLFTPAGRPDPDLFEISPLGDEALLSLVQKWKAIGTTAPSTITDIVALPTFEVLQKLFVQTELDRYAGTAISFLQLIESSSGNDISFSSYAACYETLVTSHVTKTRPNWQNLDEARNFISFLAFTAYKEGTGPTVTGSTFESCLSIYKNNFFSSIRDLREIALGGFLDTTEDGYVFREDYEWYFLCARHAAKVLEPGSDDYDSFVMDCTSNIFRKQYANMIIFMAYFRSDNIILSLLLDILDGLFSKAAAWELSDEQKTIMLGLSNTDQLAIQSNSDASSARSQILREKVVSIIDNSEEVVARFALPFLDADIGDSEYMPAIDPEALGADSYMKSTNALMRIHSVIGQILASRSGTFDSKTVLDCITRMVQASGRYIALNHAIAAVLIYDRHASKAEVDAAYDSSTLSSEEKFEKVERLFSFWSVFISQAGLARYLSHDHAIRALKMLVGRHESDDDKKGRRIPFNFSSVLLIASLYRDGRLDKELFSKTLEKYGDKSAIIPLIRVAVHFYSYYMPLSIGDKQWLATKLRMPLRRIEAQRRLAVFAGHKARLPSPRGDKPKRKPRLLPNRKK